MLQLGHAESVRSRQAASKSKTPAPGSLADLAATDFVSRGGLGSRGPGGFEYRLWPADDRSIGGYFHDLVDIATHPGRIDIPAPNSWIDLFNSTRLEDYSGLYPPGSTLYTNIWCAGRRYSKSACPPGHPVWRSCGRLENIVETTYPILKTNCLDFIAH